MAGPPSWSSSIQTALAEAWRAIRSAARVQRDDRADAGPCCLNRSSGSVERRIAVARNQDWGSGE